MGEHVLHDILRMLHAADIPFEHLTHGHVHRSEEAASIRGNTLQQAAKALIFKMGDGGFVQAVLSGADKADLAVLKRQLGVKHLALASPDEVVALTGCTIGSVPPFGNLFSIKIFFEKRLLDQETVVFSAGTHHDSIRLSPEHLCSVVKPVTLSFARRESTV